ALGAWVGGVVILRAPGVPGLQNLGLAAAALTAAGLLIALCSHALDRRSPTVACANAGA
ncbi:MAG: MFS transporter, partial [Comamonadaceae bacterium]